MTRGSLAGRHVVYAISTMGLGHVQRSLPVLRALRDAGVVLTVVSHGRALEALRAELTTETSAPTASTASANAGGDADAHAGAHAGAHRSTLRFLDAPDYPPLQRGRGIAHYVLYLWDMLRLWRCVRAEGRVLDALHARTPVDVVIADGRFGWVTPGVPSILLIHQIKVLLPRALRPWQWLSDVVQRRILSRHAHLIIPDMADPAHSLAGRLAHTDLLHGMPHTWVGPLSTLDGAPSPRDTEPVFDLLVVMGGFLEAERQAFVAWLRAAVTSRPDWKIGWLLGGGDWTPEELPRNAHVVPLALGEERRALMCRARLVVGRTGYTTLMDLRAIQGRALLFPTPGMTEHVALAQHIRAMGHTIQDLEARALAITLEELARPQLPPYLRPVRFDGGEVPAPLQHWTTAQSVARSLDTVTSILDSEHA